MLDMAAEGLGGKARMCLCTGAAGVGKSVILAKVIELTRARDRHLRVLVAQSSQMLKHCEPLQTAKQLLRRWQQQGSAPEARAARLLADAGMAVGGEVGQAVAPLGGGC